jgi:hypothetical protein
MTKYFTLSSSLSEDFLNITKKLTGHPSANALASLKSGDSSPLIGAEGNFTSQGEYDKVGMPQVV